MLDKEMFKKEIKELFEAHLVVDKVTTGMLKMWYEECKGLSEEEFKKAVQVAKYSENEPRLYNILRGLTKNKEINTIKEYCLRERSERHFD